MPFPLRFVIAFLAIDGAARLTVLATAWAGGDLAIRDLYFQAVVILFYLLLVIQLLLRTAAGRVWAAIFFALLAVLEVVKLTIYPHLWLTMGVGGRVRAVVTCALYLTLAAYLSGRRAREILRG